MKWTWLLAISGVTVTSISAFAYGCSSDQPGELGDGTHMPPGGGAVPCIDGTTQACHVKVSDHGGVLTCFTGTQSCVNGLWGVCGGSGGTLTGTNVSGGALHMSSSNVPGPAPLRAPPMAESEHARAALAGVKRRFALGAAPEGTSFRTEDNAVRATFAAGDGGFHGADVMLPLRASDPVALEAHDAQLGVSFRMRGITDVPIAIADGMAVYAGAFAGADVVHRVHPEGTEDFVSLAQKPQHEELRYDVDVTRSSALRLVSNTLEFLDRDGVPRLRVAPPYVIDARGKRHAATLGVEGCAYDKSPAPPWGRAITRPEATSCVVRITWAAGLAYPLLVDPAWTATGSMATARQFHTATLLASGNVLVTGGTNGSVLQSAEVYGFGTGTWAATGAMGNPRVYHRQASLPFGSLTLIAGGSNGLVPLNSAELYDPVAGTFAPSSSGMVSARSQFGATFMPSGNYLLTGGLTVGGIPTTSAALYDPNADTFIATPSPMGTARYAHTTSTIGSVALIAGGNNGAGTLATAETFDESTGAFTATAGAMTVARRTMRPSWSAAKCSSREASTGPRRSRPPRRTIRRPARSRRPRAR